jgi:transcriptional regulator with GAF, ATPase, and Fis domain
MPDPVPASPTAEVVRLVDEAIKSGKGLGDEALTKIAKELAKQFSVKVDEVCVLQLSPDSGVLKFLFPVKLQHVGTIPMTIAHSLAVRTVRDKRPEMINNFSAHRHPTVFEAVKLDETGTDRQPIQKIMSAPLLVDSKAVGVIQISRKGSSQSTSGADFSIRDLTALMTAAGLLAKCLKQ